MATITHREYMMRLAYLEDEWNRPSRSDHYLMQIAYRVANVLAKKAKNYNSKHYTLKFGGGARPKRKLTEADKKKATTRAKSRWFGMLGIGRK